MDVPWRIGNSAPLPLSTYIGFSDRRKSQEEKDTLIAISDYLLVERRQNPQAGLHTCILYDRKDVVDDKLLLLIEATYVPGCEEQWQKVLKWIVNLLSENKISWDVEIIDQELFYSRTDIAPFIPKMADDLLKVSPLLGHIDWVAIDILNIFSPLKRLKTPTLIISTKDVTDLRLGPAVQDIKSHTDFEEVTLLQVNSVLPKARDKDDVLLHDAITSRFGPLDGAYQNPIGGSCGLKDLQVSASIGFPISFNGLPIDYASKDVYGLTSARAFSPTLQLGATIQAPSTMDADHDLKQAREDKNYSQSLFELLSKFYKTSSRDLGKVVAISHLEHEGWLTDWCIFKNIWPEEIKPHVSLKNGSLIHPDQWIPLVPGQSHQVLRRGRSSGWTTGRTNPYPSVINIRGLHPQRSDALVYGVFLDHSMMNSWGDQYLYSWGDLGSPVFAEGPLPKRGTLLGICSGMNYASELHYITPMDVLARSVAAIMQQDMTQPKEAERVEN
ncbi:hypothetical protein EJ04DRAFT_585427 [Polyplosphaeria fusca]|uniref:Uncharacterized protein n=1 Tax=Polyplosphaeria fusca TaxID=682080 RepID=A0A9P4QQG8_9PLEO|nr:hypothetical protein EJ04DRAFT_585427 [Polyplosphaeria fusca]